MVVWRNQPLRSLAVSRPIHSLHHIIVLQHFLSEQEKDERKIGPEDLDVPFAEEGMLYVHHVLLVHTLHGEVSIDPSLHNTAVTTQLHGQTLYSWCSF